MYLLSNYEKKVQTVMVNNSTDIRKETTNNHLLNSLNTKRPPHMTLKIPPPSPKKTNKNNKKNIENPGPGLGNTTNIVGLNRLIGYNPNLLIIWSSKTIHIKNKREKISTNLLTYFLYLESS